MRHMACRIRMIIYKGAAFRALCRMEICKVKCLYLRTFAPVLKKCNSVLSC